VTSIAAPLLSLLVALSLGCTKAPSTSEQGVAPQPQTVGDVSVEIAGVTLGDDCGTGWMPPPPATPAKRAAPSQPSEQDAPSAVNSGARYRCQQTSVQLAVHATATSGATPVKIKKVELLDADGKVLGELAASSPMRWSDKGTYEAWDQNIAPNEHAAISYVLASPAWNAMEGGQYAQANKMFQLRVTVAIGPKDRVIEKKAIQPTIMPPAVPT
jgi:hypothetical protein